MAAGYTLEQWRAAPDDDKDLLLALDELVCDRCGSLREDCSNPEIDWHPHADTCWASASLEWAQRQIGAREQAAKIPEDRLRDSDGQRLWVAPFAPAPESDPLR